MTQMAGQSLLDRIKGVAKSWLDVSDAAADGETFSFSPDLADADMETLRRQVAACLEGKGGEVSARARAAALGREYLSLSQVGRRRFLTLLAAQFGPDAAKVDAAVDALRAAPAEGRAKAEQGLRDALEPPRLRVLTQFNALPQGIKFLVDLRAELAAMMQGDVHLKAMERDLRGLLAAWFDVGFLELRRLTWDSPAAILEKLIQYEAVHTIHGWEDLKNRLDSDRRLYGFFHPRMPDEPLIFVEVALVDGMAGNVQALLDLGAPLGDPNSADTAIFYSINNAQRGLNGISFGNFLIKRVVEQLTAEFKSLKTFATLSPIPGFRTWLDGVLAEGEPGLLHPAEHKALADISNGLGAKGSLKTLIADPGWMEDDRLAEVLRPIMLRLAARCLCRERKGPRALDPVAHFHLSNGARIERINWKADVSAKGLSQSCGMMVNYLYKPEEIESNHEAYVGRDNVVISNAVKMLLKG